MTFPTHVTGGRLHDDGATLAGTDSIMGVPIIGTRFTSCTWTSGANVGSISTSCLPPAIGGYPQLLTLGAENTIGALLKLCSKLMAIRQWLSVAQGGLTSPNGI